MSFAYPYLLALPILFFALLFLPRRKKVEIPFPDTAILGELPRSFRQIVRTPLLIGLLSIAIVLISIAAARPQRVTLLDQSYKGRDLMLALDISGSMKENDFDGGGRYLNRLEAVKRVVAKFVQDRLGDRIGLAVFGTAAYLQCPLTTDHALLTQLVGLLQVGIAGEGTAIGDGLGVALKRLKEIKSDSKAIILLTDGANNSGEVNPLQAARIAKELGIKVHTIGIGSSRAGRIRSMQNMLAGRAEFDEKTLQEIATTTGGVYFHASNLEGLERVYSEIDKLESSEGEDQSHRLAEELYPGFVLGAVGALALYLVLLNTFLMRLP